MSEIIEGNAMILEFMGFEPTGKDYGEPTFKGEEKGTIIWPSKVPYHTSWDWLMPVVEKIEKYAKVDIGSYQVCIWYKYEQELKHPDGFYCSIPVNQGETKIYVAYRAIIAFIQWYNQNQK